MNISCDWLCKLWSGKCSLSVVTCYWFTNGLFTKPHQIFMYKYVYTNFKELEFNSTQWAARRPGSIQQPSSSLSENNLVPVLWRWITWGGGGRRSGYPPPPHTLWESSASQWNKAPAQIGIVKLWVCLEMASGRLRQVREDGLLSSLTHYPSSLWGSCLFSIADRNLFFFRCFFDDGFMGLCISCKQKSALWLRIPLFNKKHTRCQATNTSDSFIVRGHQTAALLSMLLQKAGSLQTDISTKWQPTSFCNQQSVPKGLTWPHRRDWLSMMIATSQKILTTSQTPQYHQNAATTN